MRWPNANAREDSFRCAFPFVPPAIALEGNLTELPSKINNAVVTVVDPGGSVVSVPGPLIS